MLHPEQFLLEKEKVPVPRLINENEKVVDHCRERNADKFKFWFYIENRKVRKSVNITRQIWNLTAVGRRKKDFIGEVKITLKLKS